MPAVYPAAITFGGERDLVKTLVIENPDFNLSSAFVLQILPTQPKPSQILSQSVGIVRGFLFSCDVANNFRPASDNVADSRQILRTALSCIRSNKSLDLSLSVLINDYRTVQIPKI